MNFDKSRSFKNRVRNDERNSKVVKTERVHPRLKTGVKKERLDGTSEEGYVTVL